MTRYHHLNAEERTVVLLERDRGGSPRQIALRLNSSPARLSPELRVGKPRDPVEKARANFQYTFIYIKCRAM